MQGSARARPGGHWVIARCRGRPTPLDSLLLLAQQWVLSLALAACCPATRALRRWALRVREVTTVVGPTPVTS